MKISYLQLTPFLVLVIHPDAVGLNYINYSLVIINYISKLIIFIGLNRMHLGICT